MENESLASPDPSDIDRIANDPRYRLLVSRRGRLGWTLSAIMFAAYVGFILLVAFAKPLLARPLNGGAVTLGIPLGLAVILLAIALTALYVRRANTEFDALLASLLNEPRA